jgi:electron transport complex protein RnfE
LILSRAEAFASKNTIGKSMLDALGMGVGFIFALFCLGAVREVLGNGTFFGFSFLPNNFQAWIVMILPAGGFFTLAAWLLIFNVINERRSEV